MASDIQTTRLTYADQGALHLIADLAFNEQYTSAALNRKFYGIARPGIYRGFNYAIGEGLTMTVGDDSGEDTAYVERDRHCMTIHGQHAVTLNIPAGVKSAIVIEGFYQYGVETKQVNSNSQTDAATMKVIPSSAIESHHVVVCEVSVPTGAKAITANMISEDKRIAGGIDLASHIDVTKDPHKQYAFRKIKINTVGPLRGGHDLSEDLTLTVDPSTVGTAGVVQLEDGSTSNSIVKAPTAYALTRERMRAEGAEAELTQNLADTEVRVKAYADGKANEAEGHARVYADQVGATTLASAKTYADNVSRQAQANAEAVAIQQGTEAKQHADSVAADAKKTAIAHADQVGVDTLASAKAFATSEAKAAEGRAKTFATSEAQAAEARANATARQYFDDVVGGAGDAYDTLLKIQQELVSDDNAQAALTAEVAKKLDKTATAVNSLKLEGKSKSEVITEARNGLATVSQAQNMANSAENNAKADAASKYLPKGATAVNSDKLGNVAPSGYHRATRDLLSGGVTTTETLMSWLQSQGAFDFAAWSCRCSWSYADNGNIPDSETTCGTIPLAGAVIDVYGALGRCTVVITTATTSSDANAKKQSRFTYVDNGDAYSPGWVRDFNTANPPSTSDVTGRIDFGRI